FLFCFSLSVRVGVLLSFPTRRSSDLGVRVLRDARLLRPRAGRGTWDQREGRDRRADGPPRVCRCRDDGGGPGCTAGGARGGARPPGAGEPDHGGATPPRGLPRIHVACADVM